MSRSLTLPILLIGLTLILPFRPANSISSSTTGLTCISPFINTCPPVEPIYLATPGSNVTVNVLAENVTSFDTYSLIIGTNASVLQLVTINAAGGLLQNVTYNACTGGGIGDPCAYWLGLGQGDVRVYGSGAVTDATSGLLFTVTYRVLTTTNSTEITLFDQVSPSGWSCACAIYYNSVTGSGFQTSTQGAEFTSLNPLIADVNNDCSVGFDDLLVIMMAYGSTPGLPTWNPHADLNKDSRVDFVDLVIWELSNGATC